MQESPPEKRREAPSVNNYNREISSDVRSALQMSTFKSASRSPRQNLMKLIYLRSDGFVLYYASHTLTTLQRDALLLKEANIHLFRKVKYI